MNKAGTLIAVLSLFVTTSLADDSLKERALIPDAVCTGVPQDGVHLFPFPGDCTRYYRCNKGARTTVTCPNGDYFNEALEACDHPSTSGCRDLVCPPGIVDYYPVPADCSEYYECYLGTLELRTCPPALWFNAYIKSCVTPQQSLCGQYATTVSPTWTTPPTSECTGVLPGFIVLKPYPYDCNRYIECIGAVGTVLSCPPFLYFDYERQMCDQPAIANCDDSSDTPDPNPPSTLTPPTPPNPIDDPRCADGYVKYLPDPDCNKFIVCFAGHGYEMSCPSGLYFSPTDQLCEDPKTANCGKTPSPPPPTKPTGWTPDPDCPWPTNDRYLYPYPGDCSKFLECVYGEKEVEVCPPGLWFNPSLLVCDYPYESGCIYHKA